jgi:hypothetical protein
LVMGFPITLPSGKGMSITTCYVYPALIVSTFSPLSRVQIFNLTLHSLDEKVELFFSGENLETSMPLCIVITSLLEWNDCFIKQPNQSDTGTNVRFLIFDITSFFNGINCFSIY